MYPLLTACLNTKGPIIEFGMGEYSTPLLHTIGESQCRDIISTDTSKEWIYNFSNMGSKYHKLYYVPVYEDDFEKNPKPEMWDTVGSQFEYYGVVFIDHRPGERRRVEIEKYKNKADILVVHDTGQKDYQYENVLNKFKFRYDCKRYTPYTTLVSNKMDVSLLFLNKPK